MIHAPDCRDRLDAAALGGLPYDGCSEECRREFRTFQAGYLAALRVVAASHEAPAAA